MRRMTAADMLDAWERACSLGAARRSLELLSGAWPEEARERLAALSIGARDARLLTLREWFFGTRIVGQVDCPRCGEPMETSFAVEDVRAPEAAPAADLHVVADGTAVWFRLPDSTDLDWLEQRRNELSGDAAGARRRLLERCIEKVEGELSERGEEEVVSRMSELDTQANLSLALACSACGHRWSAPFDIAEFLWHEVQAWARRMLREVHVLASAYGWSEREILSMSATRRAIYLEMAQS